MLSERLTGHDDDCRLFCRYFTYLTLEAQNLLALTQPDVLEKSSMWFLRPCSPRVLESALAPETTQALRPCSQIDSFQDCPPDRIAKNRTIGKSIIEIWFRVCRVLLYLTDSPWDINMSKQGTMPSAPVIVSFVIVRHSSNIIDRVSQMSRLTTMNALPPTLFFALSFLLLPSNVPSLFIKSIMVSSFSSSLWVDNKSPNLAIKTYSKHI